MQQLNTFGSAFKKVVIHVISRHSVSFASCPGERVCTRGKGEGREMEGKRDKGQFSLHFILILQNFLNNEKCVKTAGEGSILQRKQKTTDFS